MFSTLFGSRRAELIITPEVAASIYKQVDLLGKGAELKDLDNLKNDPRQSKMYKALQIILGDKFKDIIQFGYNKSNGYIIILPRTSDVSQLIDSIHRHFNLLADDRTHQKDQGKKSASSNVIDNKIHFIWAGGNTMPDKNLDVISKWANLNPEHEIIIWVDEKTTDAAEMNRFIEKARSMGKNIVIKDITKEGVINPAIRHELDKDPPNYGKSSDMIRINALYKEGGIYLDSDVYPNEVSFPLDMKTKHGILFCAWTQRCNQIGNDIIMCAAGNEIMGRLARDIEASYLAHYASFLNANPETGRHSLHYSPYDYESDMKKNRTKSYLTISQTGPGFLRMQLYKYGVITNASEQTITDLTLMNSRWDKSKWTIDDSYLLESKNSDKPVYFSESDLASDQSWLKPKNPRFKSYDEAMSAALESIQFEIENMHLLRVNDYVNRLKEYRPDITNQEVADNLFNRLDALFQQPQYMHLADNIQAAHIIPYMGSQIGKLFFEKYLSKVQDGLYLYHLVEYKEQGQWLSTDEKKNLLLAIAATFSSNKIYYFGEYDNNLTQAAAGGYIKFSNRFNPADNSSSEDHVIEKLNQLIEELDENPEEENKLKEQVRNLILNRKLRQATVTNDHAAATSSSTATAVAAAAATPYQEVINKPAMPSKK